MTDVGESVALKVNVGNPYRHLVVAINDKFLSGTRKSHEVTSTYRIEVKDAASRSYS